MHNLVDFFEIAERLECEYRLTRTSDGNQQTVAAHSWNMLMMAMVLRPYLKKSVNMERVYELCVLHDLPEAITHDIPLHEQTDSVRVQKRINESDAVAQTEGWLWTGQYPEAKRIIEKGNNQSMELSDNFLDAVWSKDGNGKP